MELHPKKRKVETYKLCPHCHKELNLKRYKEHKRLYFNDDTKQWLKEESRATVSESSSDFSSLDEGDVSKDVQHGPEDDWILSTDLDDLSQPCDSPNMETEHQSIPDSDHLQGTPVWLVCGISVV